MLTINLLPESARKHVLTSVEQFHRAPIAWLAVVILLGGLLCFWVPITVRQHQLQQLNEHIQTLEPKKAEVDHLQQSLQQLRAQETAFRGLKKGEGLWARRLNTLATVTPVGVWFTELNLNLSKGLIIQGAAIGQGGPEMVAVGRLVQDLKADAYFASLVKDIQIESIKRIQDGEIEVVQFTLACTLNLAAL